MTIAGRQRSRTRRRQCADRAAGRSASRRRSVQAYLAEPGRRADSEAINITLTQPDNPADKVQSGEVDHDSLRVGWTAPEQRDNGKGIRGGKPWFQASGIRPAHAARKADAA